MINVAALRRAHSEFLAEIAREIDEAQLETGAFIKNQVANHSPFKKPTGALAKATETRFIKTRRGNILRVSNRKKYALAQEEGARPHIIRARKAKALRFMGKGGLVFRKSVKHPGNRATHWLYRGVMAAEAHEFNFLGHRLAQIARKFSIQRV